MRVGRLVLVVATLVAILVFPLVLKDAVSALRLPSAYAAPNAADAGGRVYQNGNNDDGDNDDDDNNDDDSDNDDDDDSDNNDDDDNGNSNNDDDDDDNDDNNNDNACYQNLNSNEEVPCDDNGNYDDGDNSDSGDNSDGNDNYYAPPPPSASAAPSAAAASSSNRSCFSAGQSGSANLDLSGGSVIVTVVSPGLPSGAWIGLDAVTNLASVPAPPAGATVLDSLVFNLSSGAGCEGSASGQITGDVNLGIPYSVAANKANLRIVYLQNGQWVEVPTSADPDPNKPYISATIRNTGTYAVIQRP
jgi:hypothetical protein